MRNWRRTSFRIWLILTAVWVTGSLAWTYWYYDYLVDTVSAIACGYPNTEGKEYQSCVAAYLQASSRGDMWNWFFEFHWPSLYYVVLPPLVLLLFGTLVAKIAGTNSPDIVY